MNRPRIHHAGLALGARIVTKPVAYEQAGTKLKGYLASSAAADQSSWGHMKQFLRKILPEAK